MISKREEESVIFHHIKDYIIRLLYLMSFWRHKLFSLMIQYLATKCHLLA